MVANGLIGHGITVAVMNYSLCPKVTIPEITRQSRALTAWFQGEASNYNADPARISCLRTFRRRAAGRDTVSHGLGWRVGPA